MPPLTFRHASRVGAVAALLTGLAFSAWLLPATWIVTASAKAVPSFFVRKAALVADDNVDSPATKMPRESAASGVRAGSTGAHGAFGGRASAECGNPESAPRSQAAATGLKFSTASSSPEESALQGAPGVISFAQPAYSVNEGDGAATLTLTRSGGTSGRVSVKVTLADVTTSPADYRQNPAERDATYAPPRFGSIYENALTLQPDGKLLVSSNYPTRLNSDGSVDPNFGVGLTLNGSVSASAVQPDGKIIIVGSFTTVNLTRRNGIARLNADGTLDPTFDIGVGTEPSGSFNTVAVQPDGKIIVAGLFSTINGMYRSYVARLNSDGTLDTTFVPGADASTTYALALQPDGKVLAGGLGYKGLVRLNADGSVDNSFLFAGGTSPVMAVALQPDGKILIGGRFNTVNGITSYNVARLNPNGTTDQTFNTGTGPDSTVNAVAVQPDSKVLIAGPFSSFNGSATSGVARLNSDGSRDTTFNPPARITTGYGDPYAMVIQKDGKIIVGYYGALTRFNGDLLATWDDSDAADKTIILPIVDDLLDEPDETLNLTVTPLNDGVVTGAYPVATLTIVDNDVPPTITSPPPSSLVNAGTYVSHTFTATGYPAPTFSVPANTLPPGLNLGPSGQLSGYSYTPGTYNITLTASNGVAPAASQTFSIRVNGLPIAGSDSYATDEDTTLTVAAPGVLTNDTDPDHDPLTPILVTPPTHGTVSLQPDGSFTYAPAANFAGSDFFTYKASDGNASSGSALVSLRVNPVNDPPVANNDQYTVNQDAKLSVLAPGVLSNDRDVDNDPLTAELVSGTSNGTLSLSANGSFTYTPKAGYVGADSFTYRASDGQASSGVATVTLNVVAVNHAPVNIVPAAPQRAGPGPLVFSAANGNRVAVSDVDAGNNPVRVSLTATNGTLTLKATAGLTFTAGGGTNDTFMTFTGTMADINSALDGMSFAPRPNFSGPGQLQILTNDLGNTGAGGPLTDLDAVSIAILPGGLLQFSSPAYQFGEGAGRATITVTRTGDTSGAASVTFNTVDDPAAVPCDPTAKRPDGSDYPHGVAYARCDYATTVETVTFAAGDAAPKTVTVPIIDDVYVEGPETVQLRLLNPVGATLGAQPTATLTITDNDFVPGATNPILLTQFFVRQQYLDFLSREPEPGEPWSAALTNCAPNDASCDRVTVSAAFFRSQEFQLKGLFVFKFYKAAFGRMPAYSEVVADMRAVTGSTTAELVSKKAAFTSAFAQRAEFAGLYNGVTNQQFVDALMGRYNLTQITTPDPANPDGTNKVPFSRADLVNALNASALTRAQVLRAVSDSDEVGAAEFNPAFVAMQYFGYLRRDPEAAGYNAWLNAINANPSDTRTMVNGFMNSTEYRLRFGQP